MLCKHIMAVMPCSIDITWQSFAAAYSSSKFFKIDVNVIKDDIHVADNISDGFDEIPIRQGNYCNNLATWIIPFSIVSK